MVVGERHALYALSNGCVGRPTQLCLFKIHSIHFSFTPLKLMMTSLFHFGEGIAGVE
jgi:hypothetical protein